MALGSTITQVTDSGLKPGITFPNFVSTGIATATNFKTGTTDVHSTGVTVATSVVGSAVTSNSTGIDVTGIVTATTFKGALTGDVTGNATGNARGLTGSPNITIGTLNASTGSFSSNVTISGNLGVAGTITYEDVARVDATGISTFREGFHLGPLAGVGLTAYKDGSIRSTGIITASSFVGDGSGLTGAGPSLANGANNRVITASSATALNGESNLTFDGNNLAMNGTGVFTLTRNSRTLTLEGNYGNEGHPAIKTSSGHDLRIFTNGNNEKLRITSAGRLGIGKGGFGGAGGITPDELLHISGDGDDAIVLEYTGTSGNHESQIQFHDFRGQQNATIANYLYNDGSGQQTAHLVFKTANTGTLAERLRITSAGKIGVGVDPSSTLSVKDVTEFTAYANATPSSTQCLMQLWNNPPNETTGDHASMQFAVNGGSHNRVNTISAVAESAGNRKLAFAFCTDEAGSRTEKMRITGDGQVTKPHQPRFCIIGGSNLYNNSEGSVWTSNVFNPNSSVNSGNAVHVNVGSHYSTSNGRWTVPIAGTYYFFFYGSTGTNSSHFVYVTKNGSGVNGDLGLEYSDAHRNFGGSVMTTCSAGDYFNFQRRGSGYRFYSLVWGGWLLA